MTQPNKLPEALHLQLGPSPLSEEASMVSLRNRFLSLITLAALLLGVPAHTQTSDGTITGVARDASGAVVPGVTVTVTNQAMGATKTVHTSGEGGRSEEHTSELQS